MNIGETIRKLRQEKGVSQEALASKLNISMQAVSKWECAGSLPDVALLPEIAAYFGVTIDALFGNPAPSETTVPAPDGIPDDGKLRVVQFLGRTLLSQSLYKQGETICLEIETCENLEVWGDAHIEGDIGGSAQAGGNILCGDIAGSAKAGGNTECGDVGGSVQAGGGVECGDVGGGVLTGGGVECGDVGGDAHAGGNVECGDVGGDVQAGSIACADVGGSVQCQGDIHCAEISNAGEITCADLYCEGDISAKSIRKA